MQRWVCFLLTTARSGGRAVPDTIFLPWSVFYPKTLHLSTTHQKKHPATGTSDGKKTEKTAYTKHSDWMSPGKLFFFSRMADTRRKADGELRSFKKIRKHSCLSTGMPPGNTPPMSFQYRFPGIRFYHPTGYKEGDLRSDNPVRYGG